METKDQHIDQQLASPPEREVLTALKEINAELLAACKAALGAFEHNHAIDWSELERAIAKADAAPPVQQKDDAK